MKFDAGEATMTINTGKRALNIKELSNVEPVTSGRFLTDESATI